jgi:hypothetical protein
MSFLHKEEDTVLLWEFKFNSVPAVAETRHLKGCLLKVTGKNLIEGVEE